MVISSDTDKPIINLKKKKKKKKKLSTPAFNQTSYDSHGGEVQ